jgi:hypothetical protein
MTAEDLDALSSRELHDRAFSHALRHADLRFFLDLLAAAPAAHAGEGEIDEAYNDVLRPSSLLTEAIHRDPTLLDALRPMYVDYLSKQA